MNFYPCNILNTYPKISNTMPVNTVILTPINKLNLVRSSSLRAFNSTFISVISFFCSNTLLLDSATSALASSAKDSLTPASFKALYNLPAIIAMLKSLLLIVFKYSTNAPFKQCLTNILNYRSVVLSDKSFKAQAIRVTTTINGILTKFSFIYGRSAKNRLLVANNSTCSYCQALKLLPPNLTNSILSSLNVKLKQLFQRRTILMKNQTLQTTPSANTQVTISSLEISRLTNKLHKNVLVDIRNMFSELKIQPAKFEDTFLDKQGKERPCYNLPKNEALCLVSGYSAVLRMKIIKRLEELENSNKTTQAEEEQELIEKQQNDLHCVAYNVWSIRLGLESIASYFYKKTISDIKKELKSSIHYLRVCENKLKKHGHTSSNVQGIYNIKVIG